MTDLNTLPPADPTPATPTPAPAPAPPANWAAFSPNGRIATILATMINSAKRSIDIAMYEWTNPTQATAIIAARKRSVVLRTVLDAHEAKARLSQSTAIAKSANDVRLCAAFYIMHNKFLIIDKSILVTGSYNWSEDADDHNAENVICLYDQPALVAEYQTAFDSIWAKSTPA